MSTSEEQERLVKQMKLAIIDKRKREYEQAKKARKEKEKKENQ